MTEQERAKLGYCGDCYGKVADSNATCANCLTSLCIDCRKKHYPCKIKDKYDN